MDIIVTVPKRERNNIAAEDTFADENNGAVLQYWSVSRKPAELNVGDRVYFVEDGAVRYWHEFLGFEFDVMCQVTGRVWPGLNLVLKYPETKLGQPVGMRGFQGFRYDKEGVLRARR